MSQTSSLQLWSAQGFWLRLVPPKWRTTVNNLRFIWAYVRMSLTKVCIHSLVEMGTTVSTEKKGHIYSSTNSIVPPVSKPDLQAARAWSAALAPCPTIQAVSSSSHRCWCSPFWVGCDGDYDCDCDDDDDDDDDDRDGDNDGDRDGDGDGDGDGGGSSSGSGGTAVSLSQSI